MQRDGGDDCPGEERTSETKLAVAEMMSNHFAGHRAAEQSRGARQNIFRKRGGRRDHQIATALPDHVRDDLRVAIGHGIYQRGKVSDQHWSVRRRILRDCGERVAEQETLDAAPGLFRDCVGECDRGAAAEADALAIVFAEDQDAHGLG